MEEAQERFQDAMDRGVNAGLVEGDEEQDFSYTFSVAVAPYSNASFALM